MGLRERLELLFDTYVDAQYKRSYAIAEGKLSWLAGKVRWLINYAEGK